ncbi:hypothetical protein J6590_078527 [Homalodisca vitripennis]|nr:hypothetical protein J6590_078527 [Homalodisca vitripennis]
MGQSDLSYDQRFGRYRAQNIIFSEKISGLSNIRAFCRLTMEDRAKSHLAFFVDHFIPDYKFSIRSELAPTVRPLSGLQKRPARLPLVTRVEVWRAIDIFSCRLPPNYAHTFRKADLFSHITIAECRAFGLLEDGTLEPYLLEESSISDPPNKTCEIMFHHADFLSTSDTFGKSPMKMRKKIDSVQTPKGNFWTRKNQPSDYILRGRYKIFE